MSAKASCAQSKGFTLLEVLIVIAILAVLAGAVVLVLNPAEILRKARDTQRLADLDAIRLGIAYYVIATSSAELDDTTPDSNDNCLHGAATSTLYTHQTGIIPPTGWQAIITTSTPQYRDGTGWIKIDFTQLTGGSPLSRIPTDPKPQGPLSGSDNDFYYVYGCDATTKTFELLANMESNFYKNGGPGDVESRDGGNDSTLYETGTNLNILPGPNISYYWGE